MNGRKHLCLTLAASTFCILCVACDDGDLRGTFRKSKNGKTYLIVADDNGGQCGGIRVDGKPWAHTIGEAALIDPGPHRISCGGEIGFEIPKGVVYKFNYWGP